VKGDRRAAAGRLIGVTKRYPLYSRSDRALWMLGDIFEKSEKKEIAAIYLARIVRDYSAFAFGGGRKDQTRRLWRACATAGPKALAWMQAEQSAPRPKSSIMNKPLSLVEDWSWERTGCCRPHWPSSNAARH